MTTILLVALLVAATAITAIYYYTQTAANKAAKPPNNSSLEKNVGKINCTLKVMAVNKTAVYEVNGCTIKLYSNDTFTVLWVALPYKIEDGSIVLSIHTENPVSAIFEYAPTGEKVNGTRIAVPLSGDSEVTLSISSGAISEVYMNDKPVGRAISPYILKGFENSSLLKITMWGPWNVNATITLVGLSTAP